MILEAKLQMADDPEWLEKHTILGLDFGSAPNPQQPINEVAFHGAKKSLAEVRKALEYQLRERTALVEAPDAVIADLLVSLGIVLAADSADQRAMKVYKVALGYGPDQQELAQARYEAAKERLQPNWIYRQFMKHPVASAFLISLVAILLFYLLRFLARWPRRQPAEAAESVPA